MSRYRHLAQVMMLILLASGPIWAQQSHEHEEEERQPDRHRDRWYWQMPLRVMNEIGIAEGKIVADVGAGDGYFTFQLADRVGQEGKVYASDIDDRALQVIRDRCKKEDIKNISVIQGKGDDPLLPEGALDLVLMVNVIHLVEDKDTFLNSIKRSLKPEGVLVIVQWDAEKMDPEAPGWDPENRALFTLRTNLGHIYGAGYEVLDIKTFLPMQNIYICIPADRD
jgi:SAM-dependent methyltransferase